MRAAAVAAWVVCVLSALLPAWLLIGLAGGRTATTAGLLLVGGASLAVAGMVRPRSTRTVGAGRALGVGAALLCAGAPVVLAVDGGVNPSSVALFGGVAALAAVVAVLLAGRVPASPHQR